jgi:hypothetical protein
MTQSLQDLERDIEQSRAKLDTTIVRLQDKMSVSGVVDDMLGTARAGQYGPLFDDTLETIRRNPIPVMLIAAGLGLLAYRLGRSAAMERRRTRLIAADDDFISEQDLVAAEPSDARVYDAGVSPLQPLGGVYEPGPRTSRI